MPKKNVPSHDMTWESILNGCSSINQEKRSDSKSISRIYYSSSESCSNSKLRRSNKNHSSRHTQNTKTRLTNKRLPTYYDKSIQTSLMTKSKIISPDVAAHSTKDLASHSVQTHSPFGESAMLLLQQLRERLRSNGDSEGSHIVNVLQACFTKVDTPTSADQQVDSRSNPSISAQEISRPKPKSTDNVYVVLESYENKIKEQEKTIDELKILATNFCAYYEKMRNDLIGERQNVSDSPPDCRKDDVAFAELQKALNCVKLERDSLLDELKKQRQIIFDLEIRLREQAQFNNKESGVVSDYQAGARLAATIEPLRSGRSLLKESDVDSAYEEKCSKDSRPVSNNLNRIFDARTDTPISNATKDNHIALKQIDSPYNLDDVFQGLNDLTFKPESNIDVSSTGDELSSIGDEISDTEV